MVTNGELLFLKDRGWPVTEGSFDLCWLDCGNPDGMLKTWKSGVRALCICLCPDHALLMEKGSWGGDYTGAPLPPGSVAAEWPWEYCERVGVESS